MKVSPRSAAAVWGREPEELLDKTASSEMIHFSPLVLIVFAVAMSGNASWEFPRWRKGICDVSAAPGRRFDP